MQPIQLETILVAKASKELQEQIERELNGSEDTGNDSESLQEDQQEI